MLSEPVANKDLGQHWLNDKDSLEEMVGAAGINQADVVLEVGPGPGSMTRILCNNASRVIAIEFDARLAKDLPCIVQASNLEVIHGDILKFNLSDLPTGYKLATNLPYYLTGHFLRIISESTNPPAAGSLLIQKEVAERISAQPGHLSVVGVMMQYYWQVRPGSVVPAGLFTPPPKVDSQIIGLIRRQKPLFGPIEEKRFFGIVKAGFSQKRKTLLNSLGSGLRLERSELERKLRNIGIDPKRRAQTLSMHEWYDIYKTLET
ncbi:MAG TPA: 16S rRNA (adenine(1518)-N(6)/adenine(1519)-N(6))-dimethyltransferase RsmA [Candidatus Saccharimonadales bacterium]|nr:16S rRNA (adenine(1518)-N(6)/adenine(1519)-N(6))-dimethyltransferase RsmA [Candidatus Saccharimonadales bacterium]